MHGFLTGNPHNMSSLIDGITLLPAFAIHDCPAWHRMA